MFPKVRSITVLAGDGAAAAAIEEAVEALQPGLDFDLGAVLRGDEGARQLEGSAVVQPALFALTLGMAAAWRARGVVAEAVVGHSQGEVAAAVLAGALSVADGARVILARSRLLERLGVRGAMASIALPIAEIEALLVQHPGLTIAVVNTPESAVVAGEVAEVEALLAALAGVAFCRRVQIDYASHCGLVDPVLPELAGALQGLRPRDGALVFVSSVDGGRAPGRRLDAAYWCRNLREPVRFDRALDALLGEGFGLFVELSAHPTLVLPLGAYLGEGARVVGSLTREQGPLALTRNLGALHACGHALDWSALVDAGPPVALPTYPFQRRRYWLAAGPAGQVEAHGLRAVAHPVLGAALEVAEGELRLWSGLLSRPDTHSLRSTSSIPPWPNSTGSSQTRP